MNAAILLALLLVAGAPPPAADPDPSLAEALVGRIETRHARTRDLVARFVQTYRSGLLGRQLVERGVVSIKRPGRMRWEYEEPEEKLFLSDGESFYFYVPEEQADVLKRTGDARVDHDSALEDLAGRRVVRVDVTIPSRVAELRDHLAEDGIDALEADIRFPYRYLIDHGLRSAISIAGEAEPWRGGGLRFANPELQPGELRPRLRTLSIDIETTPDASRLYSVALVGDEVLVIINPLLVGSIRLLPAIVACERRFRLARGDLLRGE